VDNNPNNQERRKSERIDVGFTLIYSVEKPYTLRISLGFADDIEAVMLNLSDLGIGIIAKHNLPPGTLLYIKFTIIDLTLQGEARRRRMEITGEVASSISLPGQSHRIGIRFDKISEEDKLAISNFVKRNKFPSD
jgi:c-di-GMP-binding flagellar brake protein YcgR